MYRLSMNPETREYMQDPAVQQKVRNFLGNPQLLLQSLSDPNFLDSKMKKVLKVGFPELAPLFEKMGADMGTTKEPATPEKADAVKAEGNTLYKARKFDEAIAKYKEASSILPDNPVYFLNISAVYFMQK